MVLHQISENILKLCSSARAHQLRFVVTKLSLYVRKEVTNMTSNQLRYWELQETIRANRAKERENRRSNRTNERLTQYYQQGTLDLRAQELSETMRSHQVGESINLASVQENVRHNTAYESELQRHNVATERLSSKQLDISAATLNETIRSHRANESIAQGNLYEMQRHNQAQEGIQDFQAKAEAQYKQAMAEQGDMRIMLDADRVHNEEKRVANEIEARYETARHNRAQESIQQEQNRLRSYQIAVEGVGTGVKIASALAMALA